MAITLFKVIQRHRFRYQSKAHIRLPIRWHLQLLFRNLWFTGTLKLHSQICLLMNSRKIITIYYKQAQWVNCQKSSLSNSRIHKRVFKYPSPKIFWSFHLYVCSTTRLNLSWTNKTKWPMKQKPTIVVTQIKIKKTTLSWIQDNYNLYFL